MIRIYARRPRKWVYHDGLKNTYYWERGKDSINGVSNEMIDLIVRLDCDKHLLSFETKIIDEKTNDYIIDHEFNYSNTVNIEPNMCYYPFLGFYYSQEKYRSVYCDHLDCLECNSTVN
eukprot:254006_1